MALVPSLATWDGRTVSVWIVALPEVNTEAFYKHSRGISKTTGYDETSGGTDGISGRNDIQY
jgi:hypothetical protein